MFETMTELPHLIATVIVIFVAWLVPIPAKYSPLKLCQLLAHAIALKVNKPSTLKQRQISGLMALVTYFVLLGIIVWAIVFVLPDDIYTQSVLLYICLNYHATARNNRAIEDALNAEQKTLAKDYLATYYPADTKPLSQLGIVKGALEVEAYYWFSFWLMPVLLFLGFGAVASLLYVMLATLTLSWPSLNPKFSGFGQPSSTLKTTLDWLVLWLVAPIYSIFKSSPGWLRLFKSNQDVWPKDQPLTELLWLSIVAAGCKIEMAGPIKYAQVKVSRVRINSGQKPTSDTIKQLRMWNVRASLFVVFLIALFWLVANLTM